MKYLLLATMLGAANAQAPFDVTVNDLTYTIQENGGDSCTGSGYSAISSSYESITDHAASVAICEEIRILKGYSKGHSGGGVAPNTNGWTPGGCFYHPAADVGGLDPDTIYANGANWEDWTGTKPILNFCIVSHSTNDPTCDSHTCTTGTNKGAGVECTTGTCDDATCCDADPVKCATFSGCSKHALMYDVDCPAGGCDTATCCATTGETSPGWAVFGGPLSLHGIKHLTVAEGCASIGARGIPADKVTVEEITTYPWTPQIASNAGKFVYIYGSSIPAEYDKTGTVLLFNGAEICFTCDNDDSEVNDAYQELFGSKPIGNAFCGQTEIGLHTCSNGACIPPPTLCTQNANNEDCVNGVATGTIADGPCACACTAGYDGDRCENDINDCASDPCQNGGSCADGVDSFTCTCAVGYEGNTCQDPKTCSLTDATAEIIACENGGTADGQTGSCTCNCAAGYDGNLCQTETQCTANDFTCHNGRPVTGTIAGGCGCDCGADFLGVNCQTARDCTLQDIPCANGMAAQGQYDANNPKHGGCTCDCMGTLEGFYCEVDTTTITEGAVTTRKSTARAKADKKALRQDLKAIAKDLLAVKLTTEPDLKKAIRETRVVLEKEDFSFQMKKLLKENIKMAVGPTNDAAEQDDCQAAGAAADGSCGMLDLNEDADGELTLISTAGQDSYTIVVDGNTVLSKQVQTQNGFDMQCWDTDDWGAAVSYNLDELSPAEDRLFQCNGRIIIVGSQGALCTESSCSGNGACHPHGNSFICVCHSGYEGADCSVLNNGNSQNCTEAQTNNDRIAYQNLQCGCDC